MDGFFEVTPLDTVFEYMHRFGAVQAEDLPLFKSVGRVLAEDIMPEHDYPEFCRATMDGYALRAEDTFGASESSPVYLNVAGTIAMGEVPRSDIGSGETMEISTGGMLPESADSVVMSEYAAELGGNTVEITRSVAPLANVIATGEDMKAGSILLPSGTPVRPQEAGAMAAIGFSSVRVFRKPVIGIISTGDEIVPVESRPKTGEIRDINTYSIAAMIESCGATAVPYGIIPDDADLLEQTCLRALENSDMLIISGGSSVGSRDITIRSITALPDSEIMVHGIPLSPGKPTILARSGSTPVWGLPGQVASAMIVFDRVVKPFVHHAAGRSRENLHNDIRVPAQLTRNVHSAQGRTDYVRTRLFSEGGGRMAEPILGKSGLISTMIRADGLIEIDMNTEGLEKGSVAEVILFK